MKKAIALLFFAAACSPAKKENQEQALETPSASIDAAASLPALSDAEKAEGWKILFDGKSLNGWQVFKGRRNNTWEVKDGTLHCKPLNENAKGDGDERSDLMTTDEYGNFEFTCDWKISPKGNSGIIYRATEEFEQPYYSGPEYQLIDDGGYAPKPTEMQLSGTAYDMYATAPKTLKPLGQWNTTKIVVNKKHVEHWLNGQKIVEYEFNSPDWRKRKENSKWKDWKGYGMATKGHLDLQDHGHEVWFRNLMIKTL
jgi:hypothetical protein